MRYLFFCLIILGIFSCKKEEEPPIELPDGFFVRFIMTPDVRNLSSSEGKLYVLEFEENPEIDHSTNNIFKPEVDDNGSMLYSTHSTILYDGALHLACLSISYIGSPLDSIKIMSLNNASLNPPELQANSFYASIGTFLSEAGGCGINTATTFYNQVEINSVSWYDKYELSNQFLNRFIVEGQFQATALWNDVEYEFCDGYFRLPIIESK